MYRVITPARLVKEVREIPSPYRDRILAAISGLEQSPRPHGCEKLAGKADHYRIRLGEYRIVYVVDDAAREVRVIRAGPRQDVYRF